MLADPQSLAIYLGALLAAHVAQVLAGRRTDQILLPAVAMLGGISLLLMERLPQDLVTQRFFGSRARTRRGPAHLADPRARGGDDARDRRPLRQLVAALQVHVGRRRRGAPAPDVRPRHRDQRPASDARARPGQRSAVRAPEGDPRHLPRRVSLREPGAARRAGHAGRSASTAAAPVPRSDGRDVGHRPGDRRRPARPWRCAAVLRRVPGDAVRGDRADQPRHRRSRPVRRRKHPDGPGVLEHPGALRYLARSVRRPARRRATRSSRRSTPSPAAGCSGSGSGTACPRSPVGRRSPRSTPTFRWPRSARSSGSSASSRSSGCSWSSSSAGCASAPLQPTTFARCSRSVWRSSSGSRRSSSPPAISRFCH